MERQTCGRYLLHSGTEDKNSFVVILPSAEILDNWQTRESSYLRRELEHGGTNNQRCGVMLGSQGQRVRPVNGPQATVCQNRLRPNDDLKRDPHAGQLTRSDLTVFKSPVTLITLLTRDMTANMAASGMTVVSMPAFERLIAISCPWLEANKYGTNHSNIYVFPSTYFLVSCVFAVLFLPGRRGRTLPR